MVYYYNNNPELFGYKHKQLGIIVISLCTKELTCKEALQKEFYEKKGKEK